MANAQATVHWVDKQLRRGSFSFLFDDSLYVAPYTELLAFLQDLCDASQAKMLEVFVNVPLDISGLTNPDAIDTENYDSIGDQAIMQSRAASGALTKYTIPAPKNALFKQAEPFAYADINTLDPLVTALKTTGDAVIRTRENATVALQKGWRKDQKHS